MRVKIQNEGNHNAENKDLPISYIPTYPVTNWTHKERDCFRARTIASFPANAVERICETTTVF